MTSQATVVKIATKVQSALQMQFATKMIFESDLLIDLSKQLGLIHGKRGRGGGWEPTDAGLIFVGISVQSYRNAQAQEALKHEQELKDARANARKQRAEILQTSIHHASAITVR